MPEYLLRASQIAAKLESTAGTAATLAAADVNLRPLADGLSWEADPQRVENLEVADDLATSADFVAAVPATLNFGVTLKGSGALGTVPAVGTFLRACGMKEQQVKTITIGALSGGDNAFIQGETYSATGGKTGIVDVDLSSGGGALRYIPVTGGDLASGDTVTANSTVGTTSSTSANYAWKYTPRTTGQETATIQWGVRNTDGTAAKDLIRRLRGAMGNPQIEIPALGPARINFSFRGVEDFAGLGDVFAGVDYETVSIGSVPKLINSTLQLDGIGVRPTQISMDCGNELVLEPDPTVTGGTAGFLNTRIGARTPQLTMDPRTLDTFDDYGKLRTGNTMAVRVSFGTSPQNIDIVAAAGQLRQVGSGERSSFLVADKTIFLTRHPTISDHDYAIYFK